MFQFTFICLTETYERSNQECTVSRACQSLSVRTKNEIEVLCSIQLCHLQLYILSPPFIIVSICLDQSKHLFILFFRHTYPEAMLPCFK